MTGAEPSTQWLAVCVTLDGKGFVKTGAALTVDELVAAKWPLRRPPYLLETSIPGVLAVGDVRSGSTKRVASAVGEGSIAVATVPQVLAEQEASADRATRPAPARTRGGGVAPHP